MLSSVICIPLVVRVQKSLVYHDLFYDSQLFHHLSLVLASGPKRYIKPSSFCLSDSPNNDDPDCDGRCNPADPLLDSLENSLQLENPAWDRYFGGAPDPLLAPLDRPHIVAALQS